MTAETPAGGGRVTGCCLSQSVAAMGLVLRALRPGRVRLVCDLDEAVDVVRFGSFSSLRMQIRVKVGPARRSKDRNPGGIAHVVLDCAHPGSERASDEPRPDLLAGGGDVDGRLGRDPAVSAHPGLGGQDRGGCRSG
ncbi:glyoxalase superfamily protein [Ruegeria pomeroyi]|uniref:glyoxalase superfamily protein n=1 Tax=Ruegeria pomeroyi TaxID=89184 RepID=UPI003D2F7AC3